MKTERLILLLMRVVFSAHAVVASAAPGATSSAGWSGDLTPIDTMDWNSARAAHLLERAGFGGTPAEVAKLAAITPTEAVNYLVDYQAINEGNLPPFEPSGIYPNGCKLVPLQAVIFPALVTGYAYGIKATQDGNLAYQPTVNEFYTLLISEHAEMARATQW